MSETIFNRQKASMVCKICSKMSARHKISLCGDGFSQGGEPGVDYLKMFTRKKPCQRSQLHTIIKTDQFCVVQKLRGIRMLAYLAMLGKSLRSSSSHTHIKPNFLIKSEGNLEEKQNMTENQMLSCFTG